MAKKAPQKSLDKWHKEKWGTKSGKPSTQGPKATGERYLPKKCLTKSTRRPLTKSGGTPKKVSNTPSNLKRLQRKPQSTVIDVHQKRHNELVQGSA